MEFRFGPDPSAAYPFPWEASDLHFVAYTRPNSRVAGIRAVFATSGDGNVIVEGGKRYSLGQLLVRRSVGGRDRRQPLCVEWGDATFALGATEPHVNQGVRYVAINARASETGCSMVEPQTPKKGKLQATTGKSRR